MRNKIIKILFICITFMIFSIKTNAECSYEERKSLLNEAKKVKIDVAVEKKTIEQNVLEYNGTTTKKEKEIDIINFYVSNLTDNIFVSYYNLYNNEEKFIMPSNLEDGMFVIEDRNLVDFYTYYFVMYSTNKNCVGEEIYIKKVKKPTANPYSGFDICNNDKMEEFKYCKKYLEEEVTISSEEFEKKADSYLKELTDSDTHEEDVPTKKINYIIYIVIGSIGVITLITLILIIINKKKKKDIL